MAFLVQLIVLFVRWDVWCLERTFLLVKWLDEWFSIEQKWFERILLFIYWALMNVPSDLEKRHLSSILFPFAANTLSVLPLWFYFHRAPAAIRTGRLTMWVPRLIVQFIGWSLALVDVFVSPRGISWDLHGCAQFAWMLFFYVASLSTKSDPGRRRKLALEELKKMFGTEWMPRPVEVPW